MNSTKLKFLKKQIDMIRIRQIFILFFIFQISSLKAQSLRLNKNQMLQDFDQSVNHINTFAVHKDLNAIRLKINYVKEYKKLRNEINEGTNPCEFRKILGRAIGLVQDAHATFMGSGYLSAYGKYQKKINFKDTQTYERVKYYEDQCDLPQPNLKLPLVYLKGKYFVYSDFKYKGTIIKRETEVTTYNGKKISEYIKENYDKIGVIRWDEKLNSPYRDDFYRKGDDKFTLGFNDLENPNLTFSLSDTITFQTPKQRDVYFGSQTKKQVMYFKKSKMLYVGIPFMDAELGKSIVRDIDSIVAKGNTFSKIVLDIRGNPGGDDNCYRTVLQHLISKEIPFSSTLKFKYNDAAINFYADGQKNIVEEKSKLLNNSKYWTKEFDINKIEPDSNSIGYAGKIYVLQDEFIFSSASNLSNLCLNSSQLISVGVTTDLVGGRQTEPLFIQLDNSGLVFRVEPLLDFSGVKTLNDFYHNRVEVRITPTVNDYFIRTTYEGDIYGSKFLLSQDRLIKYILND